MKATLSHNEARKLITDALEEAERPVRNFVSGAIRAALQGGAPDSMAIEITKSAIAKRDVLREAVQAFDAYVAAQNTGGK